MGKKEKKSLVLIGISRRGEKNFQTILSADQERERSTIKPLNHFSGQVKNRASEIDFAEL